MVHSTNVLTYGISTNDKKDGFLRLIVFTIVKITSTNKEILGDATIFFGGATIGDATKRK